MKSLTTSRMAGITMLTFAMSVSAQDMQKDQTMMADSMTKTMVMKMMDKWPANIQKAVIETIDLYGLPSAVSAHEVVWFNDDMSNAKLVPFIRVRVKNTETTHNFPVPHPDFMQHTLKYDVPADMVDELATYDGSVTVMRTRGELSAECDKPIHNILALNLADEIINGKKTVTAARAAYAETIQAEMKGQKPALEQKLMFTPKKSSGYADKKAEMMKEEM